ncbi:hypothetical protein A2765_03275 [Candidatus Kaiserbacteria bacterium RIFCSPHIGHO2_01_FULL_56_24]|uniref:Oxidized purine nucleoside triphosphate hydrolase n=1 Tax=Candidatus Kaiserbacteria bacterium RIFCSPHIGHO2_01_FULL_56_24 TaxID=1798487 RepID=A0A1F6DE55_9BACT|nr:MAG: hypothetical protein A2765_03275 [Candidatus Kaiserbacteria bacterium RIFCSPHIGHO2_01_FULL_56_24]
MHHATLAFIVKDDSVLLGFKKRGEFGSQALNGPGGKIERGETAVSAIVREVQEEFGITLIPEHLTRTALLVSYRLGVPWFRVHIFLTDTYVGTPTESVEMKPEWCSIKDLPFDRLSAADRGWLPRVLRREKLCVHIHYEEDGRTCKNMNIRSIVDSTAAA